MKAWHSIDFSEILTHLNTQKTGLSDKTVQELLKNYGDNSLKETIKQNFFISFVSQFNHLLIYVLLISSVISGIMRHWVDMFVILGVILINAIIGLIQERKATTALEAIKTMLSLQAVVIRNNRREVVPAEKLVPGDIVLLKSGDKVPADLRLIETKNLQTQESILTGESLPVEKFISSVDPAAELGNRSCMAYSGTFVTNGKGMGVVVATGEQTEVGRIGAMLSQVPNTLTPLLEKLNHFAKWLTIFILLSAAFTFVFGIVFRHYPIKDMFMAAIGLAVAAIPEGLPAIITITLAIGVTRMAKQNAIVRYLPAVETLGSVTVICTDKTGTLTKNELTVQNIITSQHHFKVTGTGYGDNGEILLKEHNVELKEFHDLEKSIQAGILCNDAELQHIKDDWKLLGSPIDGALLTLGLKAEIDCMFLKKSFPITDLIPFESEHKFMATMHHDHLGNGYIYVKGAPEKILEMCSFEYLNENLIPTNKNYWLNKIKLLAEQGQRVIAIAFRSTPSEHINLYFKDIVNELTILGLFGLSDLPRDGVTNAIATCQKAGIKIKMITGDYADTAKSIAKIIGIKNYNEILTGHEIDQMDQENFVDVVNKINIYARASPLHKLRLVEALQSKGNIVAMTGDGVNDSPALKQADVGIAMGKKGTEAAKETSEIVLADDNFVSIVNAVKEGRTIFDNIVKTILYILPTDGGEALIIIISILFGWVLPITPVQILWINTITAVTLGLALAFEPAEKNVMSKLPRKPDISIFTPLLLWRVLFVSLLLMAGGFGFFIWAIESNLSVELARTITVNILVVGEIAYLFNTRKLLTDSFNTFSFKENRAAWISVGLVILLQLIFCYASWMHSLFGTASLTLQHWAYIISFGFAMFLVIEAEKYFIRKIYPNR